MLSGQNVENVCNAKTCMIIRTLLKFGELLETISCLQPKQVEKTEILKQHKMWSDEEISKLLDDRKYSELQRVHKPAGP